MMENTCSKLSFLYVLEGLSLPRKSVVRLTDHLDMTLDVCCGRKTTIQQQLSYMCIVTADNSTLSIAYRFKSNL